MRASPITVNAYEQLGVEIAVVGFTHAGTTDLTSWKLLFGMNTDEFLVSIPIAEG